MTQNQPDGTKNAPRGGRRTRLLRSTLLGAVALGTVAATGVLAPLHAPHAQAQAPAQNQVQPTAPGTAATAPVPASALPSFADVVDRVKPAVVSVRVKADAARTGSNGLQAIPDFNLPDDHPFQEFFRRFSRPDGDRDRDGTPGPRFGRPGPGGPGGPGGARQSQGSGFFVSADGYLVTNNHVIDKGSDVQVLMDDGRTLDAKVVGTDPKTDLALLKVAEGGPFPYVELAPDAPRVGDWVMAVGNPFGLGGTVTAGIVSARARDIGAGPYDDFLQIDAPVNRGNSGGPAFNLRGQVIGVNTAIASPSGGNVGIAFAIPSETVSRIVAQLKDKGTVERGYLGVQIQPVTKDIAAGVGLTKPEGAIVASVQPDSPAAKAGVKAGDVVLQVNGDPVEDARDLSRTVAFMDPGKAVTLQVWRDNAKKDLSVTIARQPNEAPRAAGTSRGGAGADDAGEPKLGLQLAPSSEVGGSDKKGVAVVAVEPGSPAAEKGLKTGDVIAEVAGKPVETPADVKRALDAARQEGKKAVLFRVEAREGARFVALQLPAA